MFSLTTHGIFNTALSAEALAKEENQPIKQYQISPKIIANWVINKKVDREIISPAKLIEVITAANAVSAISEVDLTRVIKQVLLQNAKAVVDYKAGKEQALMFLVGQVMKETKGKSSAESAKKQINDIINNNPISPAG